MIKHLKTLAMLVCMKDFDIPRGLLLPPSFAEQGYLVRSPHRHVPGTSGSPRHSKVQSPILSMSGMDKCLLATCTNISSVWGYISSARFES